MKNTSIIVGFLLISNILYAQEIKVVIRRGDVIIFEMTKYTNPNSKFADEMIKTFELKSAFGRMHTNDIAIGVLTNNRTIVRDQTNASILEESISKGSVFNKYFYTPEKKISSFDDFQGLIRMMWIRKHLEIQIG